MIREFFGQFGGPSVRPNDMVNFVFIWFHVSLDFISEMLGKSHNKTIKFATNAAIEP